MKGDVAFHEHRIEQAAKGIPNYPVLSVYELDEEGKIRHLRAPRSTARSSRSGVRWP